MRLYLALLLRLMKINLWHFPLFFPASHHWWSFSCFFAWAYLVAHPVGHKAPYGNLAECSNENTGLRAIASNIQPNKIGLNVRHNFHALTHLYSTFHFSNKRCRTDFQWFLGIFCSGSGTSHRGSALFEHSAWFSIIESKSVEPWAYLPYFP